MVSPTQIIEFFCFYPISSLSPNPSMIPPGFTRGIHLCPRIFQRYATIPHQPPHLSNLQPSKNSLSLHRLPIQLLPIPNPKPQLLHRSSHGVIMALQLQLVRKPLLVILQLGRAMDRPMAEGAKARKKERPRGDGVAQVVADES